MFAAASVLKYSAAVSPPIITLPPTESILPNRTKLRIARDAPMYIVSQMESDDPNLAQSHTDKVEPRRAKLLSDRDDPK